MSGFEVAGVVLAAFPLAISALDKYREVATRLGLFYKIRLEHKKCSNELEFQRLTFIRHLKQLLLPLVVDDDNKVTTLLATPGGESWREPSIAQLLEKRLEKSYGLYLQYIEGMEGVMIELNQELAMSSGTVQEKLCNPRPATTATTRIKNAMSQEGRSFQLYRVKFSNGAAVRKRLFANLQDYNNKLEKLLDSSDKETQLVQQMKSEAHMSAIDSAMCNFWIQASKLFKALASAWDCRCCDQRYANLLLQHRTNKKPEFQVLFTSQSSQELLKTRISDEYEGSSAKDVITLLESIPIRQPNHRQMTPVKSAIRYKQDACVELLKPPPSITLASPEKNAIFNTPRISSICLSFGLPVDSCCGYVAEEDCRYFVYAVSRRSSTPQPITLEQILQGGVYPHPTRRQRYALSLILASSFLQLSESPWLPASFNKADIIFYSDPGNPDILLLDQPHVNREFEAKSGSQTIEGLVGRAAEGSMAFSQSLDQLGIVLLELCFGNVLEKQPCRTKWRPGENEVEKAVFDIMAARDWQCDVNEEAGPDYSEAVGWCLGGNRSTLPGRWRQEMMRKAIQPLQRCCDYLSKSTGTSHTR